MAVTESRPDQRVPAAGDLFADRSRAATLRDTSGDWPSWTLTERQLADFELLATGALTPLRGYLTSKEHESVAGDMTLPDGSFAPWPVTLDVSDDVAGRLDPGTSLALRDTEGTLLGALNVSEVWRADVYLEMTTIYERPPANRPLAARVAGSVEAVATPAHYDFPGMRYTPRALRREVSAHADRVIAYVTGEPMHRAEFELTRRAIEEQPDSQLLLLALVGPGVGSVDRYTRIRCYQALLPAYPPRRAMLAVVPYATRAGSSREALLQTCIAREYGATNVITSDPLVRSQQRTIGIVVTTPALPAATRTLSLEEQERLLDSGQELPRWFTLPEVSAELQRSHRPRSRQGFVVFFTGLSGSGKSTIARVLEARMRERGRTVTVLDGDAVRHHLSAGLGFSRADRDRNIERIAFVAGEVARHGGVALCAPIAPYDEARKNARQAVRDAGGVFVLVHVATPLKVAEQRDPKGLYARARAGLIESFTGVNDPYEKPDDADVVVDTTKTSAEEAAGAVLAWLGQHGYITNR